MLDEETIERIVEKVLRRLLEELSVDGAPPRLTPAEIARGRASLGSGPPASAPRPAPRAASAARHPGRLLSEEELVRYHRAGVRVVQLEPRCLVTPAARDRARDLQVDLIKD